MLINILYHVSMELLLHDACIVLSMQSIAFDKCFVYMLKTVSSHDDNSSLQPIDDVNVASLGLITRYYVARYPCRI